MPPEYTTREECERRQQAIASDMAAIRASLARIEDALRGDVVGATPGLQARVAELERNETRRGMVLWTCITAAIIGAGSAVWQFITNR